MAGALLECWDWRKNLSDLACRTEVRNSPFVVLEKDSLSSHLNCRVRMLKYKVPTSLVVPVHSTSNLKRLHSVLSPTLVTLATQLSNVFTGKQLKLCRKDLKQRKRREGWVRSGRPNIHALHSGAVHWSRVVVGFDPGIAQEHAAAHHERGGNMPGSACTITEY